MSLIRHVPWFLATTALACGGSGHVGFEPAGAWGLSSAGGPLPAPPFQVWTALPDIYAELRIPVDFEDPGGLRLGANGPTMTLIDGVRPSHYLDCAYPGNMPDTGGYGVQLFAETTLYSVGDTATGVASTVSGMISNRSGRTRQCSSTGQLERRIYDLLRVRIERGGPAFRR